MQKHVIVGTAGHVDHGKTTLIKALTEINTDRLGEEQKRGITIELGFAYMKNSQGEKIGIIDVPGHEKFVKHMLAGAGGIDIALLIIDANEGVMPQTKEHIYILELLGIKEGIIAVTKSDTVDEEWLMVVEEDIKDFVKGTFLQDASIHCVSAYTGDGIDSLREEIFKKAGKVKSRDINLDSRLFVDRVFSLKGTGTVITGTLFNGQISLGDNLSLYPEEHPCKVRNLQVHEEDVEVAYAGQRVAVNLTGIKKEDIQRGFVLGKEDSLLITDKVLVELMALPDTERLIKHGSPIHFHSGSNNVIANIYFFEEKELTKGQKTFAQIRFSENLALKYKDKFIIRYYSPLETIGGGQVLHLKPRRKKEKDIFKKLETLRDGSYQEILLEFIEEFSYEFKDWNFYKKLLDLSGGDFKDLAESLEAIRLINGSIPLSLAYYNGLKIKAISILKAYHEENPLKPGISLAEMHSRLLDSEDEKISTGLLEEFLKDGDIVKTSVYSLRGFENKMDDWQKEMATSIEEFLRGSLSVSKDEVLSTLGKDMEPLVEALIKEGKIIRLNSQFLIHRERYDGLVDQVVDYLDKNGQITLATFRDMTDSSRKIALPILEHFDNNKITLKTGDIRTISPRFKR